MTTAGATLVPVNNCSRNGHAYFSSLALCCISKPGSFLEAHLSLCIVQNEFLQKGIAPNLSALKTIGSISVVSIV